MPGIAGDTLKSSNGALFVQIDGPNTRPEYLGCVDIGDISEPGGGIAELIRCFNEYGTDWDILDATRTPKDPVTMDVTSLLSAQEHLLEQAGDCAMTFFLNQRADGRSKEFLNYVRSYVLGTAFIGDKTLSNIVMREEDAPSTGAWAVSALPPVMRFFKKVTSRRSHSEAQALNSISFCNAIRCASAYGPAQRKCKVGVAAADAGAGVTPNVIYTTDYGVTWTAMTNDPFVADKHAISVTCFEIGNGITRVIAARGVTTAGSPAEIAYTDDFGATAWVTVSTGGANALFVQAGNGMFAIDQYDIWVVTDGGIIRHSEDGGLTWQIQHSGTLSTAVLWAVQFVDDRVGVAVGATGVVLKTLDGGFSWALMTAPVAATLNTVSVLDAQRFWVGSAGGRLYYTTDGGTTWAERSFSGSGAGQVRHIVFLNPLSGYMLHNTAAPVGRLFFTRDGGYNWELVTTATNSGLNQMAVCKLNDLHAVGEVNTGTGAMLLASPAP